MGGEGGDGLSTLPCWRRCSRGARVLISVGAGVSACSHGRGIRPASFNKASTAPQLSRAGAERMVRVVAEAWYLSDVERNCRRKVNHRVPSDSESRHKPTTREVRPWATRIFTKGWGAAERQGGSGS